MDRSLVTDATIALLDLCPVELEGEIFREEVEVYSLPGRERAARKWLALHGAQAELPPKFFRMRRRVAVE